MGNFFLLYLSCLYSAAYNIQQTLEGYGLVSSNFIVRDASGNIIDSYWSPAKAIVVLFGSLVIYFILLVLSLLMSSYVLGKWKGIVVSIFILALPGLLNVAGFWPQINYMPDTYAIDGAGDLGSIRGFITLLILGWLTGWSLMVNTYDTLS